MVDLKNRRRRVSISFKDTTSMTKQAPAGMLTPAQIMKRFASSGVDPMSVYYNSHFGDATGASDLLSATLLYQEAQTAFSELPSAVRERFKNNPVELLDFLGKEENRAEAEKLGLVTPRVTHAAHQPAVVAEDANFGASGAQQTVVDRVDNSDA